MGNATNFNSYPKDFMFQISFEEYWGILKSKKSTSSWGGTHKLPYVFTKKESLQITMLKGETNYERRQQRINHY